MGAMSTVYRKSGDETISKGAEFSECGKYRYALWRIWDDNIQKVMCIGLNPSTANAEKDDPTIESLTRLLNRAGYGGFYMMNLFAMISSKPEDLRICPDPIKDNDVWLKRISDLCANEVIFCWGNFPMASKEDHPSVSDGHVLWEERQRVTKASVVSERRYET